MKRLLLLSLLLGSVLMTLCAHADETDFPGRKLFWNVPIIEIADLYKKIDNVVIVDVRSKYEYDTLQIKGAVNIPLADLSFGTKVSALRKTTDKPIVFYCNGRTCQKSYEAVVKARNSKVENIVAFDAGIFEWAKAYPDRAVLLGKNPIAPGDLIDDGTFHARLLAPNEFIKLVGPTTLVLDVRDRFQRTDMVDLPELPAHIGLDETAKLNQYIERAKKEKKTLMVFDAVGKQVQWFQYYLERQGLKDYYFMKGGSEAYTKRAVK